MAIRKQFIFCILLSLMVIVSLTATSSSVAARNGVGLRIGDTAAYEIDAPFTIYPYNNTRTYNMTCNRMSLHVVDISGSVVGIELNYYSNDGLLCKTEIITGDTYAGGERIWIYLVAPGLNAGDPVFSGGTILINETTTRTYNTAVRVVNHLLLHHTSEGGRVVQQVELYWDRDTGLMTGYFESELIRLEFMQGDSVMEFFAYLYSNTTLISTTAWSEGSASYDYTSPFIIVGASLALLGAIAFTALIADRKRQHS